MPLSSKFNHSYAHLNGHNTLGSHYIIPRPFPHAQSRILTMSASGSETVTGLYPKPISPPYPELSKDVELNRAISAEVKSASYQIHDENDVIYEDAWIVVVNKPKGVYCETLISALASRAGSDTIQSDLHMANRLDRDTSGLMIITKSNKVASKFVKAFTNHEVKKTYLAFCIGHIPNWDRITLSSGHGRSKFGAWRVYSSSDIGRSLPGGSMVRDMKTSFEVLSINGKGKYTEPADLDTSEIETTVVEEKGIERNKDGTDEILVRAYPKSGRTHQIRLHCQYLGIPLKGDVKYGGVDEWKGDICNGHKLHAETLRFKHPISGEYVEFRAPNPSWVDEAFSAKT